MLKPNWNFRTIGLDEAWAVVPSASGVTVAVLDSRCHGALVADVIASIAPGVTILPIEVRDDDAPGGVAKAVSGIDAAIAQGASVVNVSWGGST